MVNARFSIVVGMALVLIWPPSPCCAQSSATAQGIQEAWFKAWLDRPVEAIEQYQRLLETAGDDLIPLPRPVASLGLLSGSPAFTVPWQASRSLPARWIIHEQIARLPPEALKLYRDRVDAAAAKRLQQVRARPDDRPLRQIVADYFCSRAAEDAILLLARRAFERADVDGAAYYWGLLLPGNPDGLSYPDPRTPPATIRAHLLLAKLFRGDREAARADLKRLLQMHPDATGLLAGRQGRYVDTLDELLKKPELTALAPRPDDGVEWSTFGGRPSRDSLITNRLPRYWPGPPTWTSELPKSPPARFPADEPPPPAPDDPRALAFHPIITHGRAFVADAARIYAFDLKSGERTTIFDLRRQLKITNFDLGLPARGDVKFTMTCADDHIFVRLGPQVVNKLTNDCPSAIVCFGPLTDKKSGSVPPAWTLPPPKLEKDSTAIFEGSPLVADGKLYAVVWRQFGGAIATSIVCYQVRGVLGEPELLWQREVGKPNLSQPQAHRDLLTLAGPNIVFATNAGNIIALDAMSGNPAWEFRYAPTERRPLPVGRDVCPCVFDGARIFAAPSDCGRLFCLDAHTGQPFWDIEGIDVLHLLGVTRGRLIATVAGSVRGIRGIDVLSGSQSSPNGWIQHDGGGVATFGRGFVTPDLIFWPTRDGMQFLNPETGASARQPAPGLFGNLALADGCFVVTNATEVQGFVCESKLLNERQQDAQKQPGNKLLLWKLGRAEADAGLLGPALAHFDSLAAEPTTDPELRRLAAAHAGWLRWERRADRQPADSFHCCGDVLYALLDGRALLAFDLRAGSLLWRHWAVSPQALAGPKAVVIRPTYYADGRHVLLQLSSGLMRMVDAHDGRTCSETPTSRLPWPTAPVSIDERHVVVPDDADAVVCLDLETGKLRWRHTIPRPFSLVGSAPRLRLLNFRLLLGIERNHGMELMALDPRTGASAWTAPVYLGRRTIPLEDLDGDKERLYVAAEKGLLAIETTWGHESVLAPLTGDGSDWRVVCGVKRLLVVSKRPAPVGETDLVREFRKLLTPLPNVHRLVRVIVKSYRSWKGRTLVVLVVAKENGRVVQRLSFPAEGALAEVRPTAGGATLITGSGVWKLREGGSGH
jgi:outer membrane protein assembly factor BamB